MATPAPAASGQDAMVTVKVNYQGVTRRTKMPLRETGARALESNIRTFLQIPVDTDVVIERYSDSAAAYIELDSSNVAVYKQLYRAAKAKSKLKIRVTAKEELPKPLPKPVTVEDEPEVSPSSSTPEVPAEEKPEEPKEEPSTTPSPAADAPAPSPKPMELPIRSNTHGVPFTKPMSSNSQLRDMFDSELSAFIDRQAGLMRPTKISPKTDNQQTAASKLFPPSPPPPAPRAPGSFAVFCPATGTTFAVCCNICEEAVPDVHYHCSICDDGDFDLCQSCVNEGRTCHSDSHWLIKRNKVDGQIVNSTTEKITPKVNKPKVNKKQTNENGLQPQDETPAQLARHVPSICQMPALDESAMWQTLPNNFRTCNCCVRERPERDFLHCTVCEDFDLCQSCFAKEGHGHHPKHAFIPAVEGTKLPDHIKVKLGAGRNKKHPAICDGCDKEIYGVRHKCLDCPDWDFCGNCIPNAKFIHPNHRFVPVYEELAGVASLNCHIIHVGICCDGPLCAEKQNYPSYIRGIRYKCAVCNDFDLCANCEASPSNNHNKTHPLIKFKTPVRHVSVTTTGEHQNGQRMPSMGDRRLPTPKAPEHVPAPPVAMNTVRPKTVLDMKPAFESVAADIKKPELEMKNEASLVVHAPTALPAPAPVPAPVQNPFVGQELKAVFLRDKVQDGTIFAPNSVFQQTWVLRNEGNVAWPAGCSVKFVGGDYMGHVDSNHPAGISELVSASESTVCYAPLAPGQEFPFTVLLRTPARAGKLVSYWRLTTPDGLKFGHRLWCDVNVRVLKTEPEPELERKASPTVEAPVQPAAQPVEHETEAEVESEVEPTEEPAEEPAEEPKVDEDSQASSQMIFPKLEKESPIASMHEDAQSEPQSIEEASVSEDFEICAEDGDWNVTEDGFMTDEEYDILDASDEEYLEEHKKQARK